MNTLMQEIDAHHLQRWNEPPAFAFSSSPGYADIVLLASVACGTPMAAISVFDRECERFVVKTGIDADELPAADSFYLKAAPEGDAIFIIPDTRCADCARVAPWAAIRFYAGVPLITKSGERIGMLSVMDHEPRCLADRQRRALAALGRRIVEQVELDRKLAELEETTRRFMSFMDNSPVLASLKDENGKYLYVNRPFLRRCGLQLSGVLGKTDIELWPEEIAGKVQKCDRAVLADGDSISELEAGAGDDGSKTYWQVIRFRIDGKRPLLGSMGLDITKAKCYESQLMAYQKELQLTLERLEVLSITDSLTELYNRRAFDEKLKEEFERARRYNLPLSLLLLDIDNFKTFNDTMGHTEGDELLRAVAAMLRENARANDIPARYGGDEFAVILPNTRARVAFSLAERLRRNTRGLARRPFPVTLSIGVAPLSEGMANRCELVTAADKALYGAKRNGRNQVSASVAGM